MALSIFIDALPYTEMHQNYSKWFDNMQLVKLLPNIAYSSSLHWQLYCDKYPDDRGTFVDWGIKEESNLAIRILSHILRPTDNMGIISVFIKKFLDRYVFRKNVFANIPFKFRPYFGVKGKYLFWDAKTYSEEKIFSTYLVISQDEGHITFDQALNKFRSAIQQKIPNIFFNTGFADAIGHKCRRGEIYSQRLKPYMEKIHTTILEYMELFPNEEILIISDHGMSTINQTVDFEMEKKFGSQGKDTYIAYSDSCIMCVWVYDRSILHDIKHFLKSKKEGHLLTDKERKQFRTTNHQFGDLIYILREGNCFTNNWFGKSIRKPSKDGASMHGFWPEWSAYDQLASIILINGKRQLKKDKYTYPEVHELIKEVMLEK